MISRTFLWAGRVLGLYLCLAASSVVAQTTPTVNGQFFGDGDNSLYSPYQTSANGSVLYSYLDISTTTLYVALVVNQTNTNDMVCSPQSNSDYTSSAGWGPHRSCKRASDSEFASWTLECAPGSVNSWAWQQALGCAQTAGPPPSNWVSNASCGPSSPAGDWPPGVEANSSTSWVSNVNTRQSNPTTAWNLYAFGTDIDNGWKSPFVSSAPNDVTQVPGYPNFTTYSSTAFGTGTNVWEWPMVYEWSVDLGPGGTNCANEAIFFITGLSHHSPAKNGDEDDVFPPPENPEMSDWGDLPDSYGTLSASGGPRHLLKITGPYLGPNLQPELDGTPTADATGDGTEEDGVTAVVDQFWSAGSTRSIEVEVNNAPGGAVLAGWFDWNGDGDFDDPGEYFTWNVSEGTNTLSLTVGSGFDWQNDTLYARFRVFSSGSTAPGGSLTQADYVGMADDGEVEDYVFEAGALPVSLNAFESAFTTGGLGVTWQTASETNNVGFEIWGRENDKWRVLGDFVPSQGGNTALPQTYEETFPVGAEITALALVDYDTRGQPEGFGPFTTGEAYGEIQPAEEVDWQGPRLKRKKQLVARGFANTGSAPSSKQNRWRRLQGSGKSKGSNSNSSEVQVINTTQLDGSGANAVALHSGPQTHVEVLEPGIQRVSYEALRAAGLDLSGVHHDAIAVTRRGEPVSRWIEGSGNRFGPGQWIEFVGQPPQGDDALYIDAELYQVSVDPAGVREAQSQGMGRVLSPSAWYEEEVMVDRPLLYHHQSPTGDPWVERTVLSRGGRGPASVTMEISVAGPVADGPASVVVGLGAISNLPDNSQAGDEHNVEVLLKGPGAGADFVPVTTASVSGQRDWEIEAPLPSGFMEAGTYQLRLRFETEYFFSLVVVDRYGLRYSAPYRGPELDFEPDRGADGYRVEGLAGSSVSAYGEGGDGSLTRLMPRVSRSGGGYVAELRAVDAARIWVSEDPQTPQVFTTAAPGDLLAEAGDLVVVADSGFIGTDALEDYIQSKSVFNPVVVDVEDIYNAVGYGMALPGAITDYLKARDAVYPFTHVQLVGTDCYDRLNYISECLSFIPLPTARVGVTAYSPSQNRLVDLDGDGVGDKAVGQFSVREASELATIVGKGSDWRSNVAGLETALLVAEESDGTNDFIGQIERLRDRLSWDGAEVLDMADHPGIDTARAAFRSSLQAGRTLTMFSGHSSPTVWGFRSLVTASTAKDLGNEGMPTLMVPLACESTYDISPNANVLGHQLMYSGRQGALAISGAVSLSGLGDNERMANHVVDGMKQGLTLGEAVQAARDELGSAFQTLHDNWITQGDVTTRLDQ